MKTSYVLSGLLLLAACRKDDTSIPGKPSPGPAPLPEMLYTDLKNKEMKHQQPQFVDLDNDGSKDIGFGTWYIGDPLEKEDEVLFLPGLMCTATCC
jgi:hypothetical protein